MKNLGKSASKFVFALVTIGLLAGCGSGEDGVIGTGLDNILDPEPRKIGISGAAQKGPYVTGSKVLLTVLLPNGDLSGQTVLTETKDNLGNFDLSVTEPGPVLISVDGQHFNEIEGKISTGRLKLHAVYDITDSAQQSINVNILTHLTQKRAMNLMSQDMIPREAIAEAESELARELNLVLPAYVFTDFAKYNLFNTDESSALGDGYTLAVSATIYQYAINQSRSSGKMLEAELSEVLDVLASDLADDGQFTNSQLMSDLLKATKLLRPDQIRTFLEEHGAAAVDRQLSAADIDPYIDTDSDGLLNSYDDDDDNDGISDAEDPTPYLVPIISLLLLSKQKSAEDSP